MITPIDIANFFIKFFNDRGDYVSHLKIQKMLYYTDVWYRVYFGSKLFDERPQAWVHGPVYPSVYKELRDFGAQNIIVGKSAEEIRDKLKELFIDDNSESFINDILKFYGVKSAFSLELMTHNEEPWKIAREGLADIEPCTNEIDMESATQYYTRLLKDA